GHRTEWLPGAGRDGSRGLEERGDAVAFVPAARRRDGTAGGVAPDAADCEPLKREGLTTKLTTRGAGEEKAPQRKSLQGLIFTQSGRRDLNPRPPEPHSGALPDCATSRYPTPETPPREQPTGARRTDAPWLSVTSE